MCVSGTNALEGFHQKLNALLSQHRSSPRLAYNVVMHFISKWNITRARDILGRTDGYTAYFNQARMEELILLSRELGVPAPFSIRCTHDYVDSGERFGVIRKDDDASHIALLNAATMAADEPVPSSPEAALAHLHQVLSATRADLGLAPSELDLAQREGTIIPNRNFDPVAMRSEAVDKFTELLGETTGRGQYGGPDFEKMADLWEAAVCAEEVRIAKELASRKKEDRARPAKVKVIMYRKTAQQLERWYDSTQARATRQAHDASMDHSITALYTRLRQTDAAVVAPKTSNKGTEPVPSVAAGDLTHARSTLPPALASAAASLPRRTDAPHLPDFVAANPPVSDQLKAELLQIGKCSRRPFVCKSCGHYRNLGVFRQCHDQNDTRDSVKCDVPQRWRWGLGDRGHCDCVVCAPYADKAMHVFGTGTSKYPKDERRANPDWKLSPNTDRDKLMDLINADIAAAAAASAAS